ncbi:MAG: homoserine kinase [Byssovorax sp.]
MAVLTPLSLDEARALGARYGLVVTRVRGIPAGSVNSNFELGLASGDRAFLRVYEEQTAASAAGEAALLAHLAAHGVPTPRPLSFPGDPASFIAAHAGKAVAVFPWIQGESLCQARLTPDATRRVGEALARVHAAGASFAGASPSRFGPAQLDERLRKLRSQPLDPTLSNVVAQLSRRLEPLRDRAPRPGASGLCHGDLFRDNVLWENGEISALLDFESASIESYPFDLMVTLLAFCFGDRLDRDLCRAMIDGYRGVRPITAEEAALLHPEGSFAALRFTITRITDFELRPRGTGVYKDYRRFLARSEALDALGPAGLLTFLGV